MLKLKYLFENYDLAKKALENWEYDKDTLDDLLSQFRISSNAVYPYSNRGNICFLRLTPTDEVLEKNILGELEFIEYLNSKGYAALKPIKAKSGDAVLKLDTEWGQYYASSFARVQGTQIERTDYNEKIMYQYGKALGRLHTLSSIRSIGTTIAPAIMIGFIAHAGSSLQANEMALLPKEVSAPELPYAQELTEKLNEMKSDPNMKDKMAGFDEMSDLYSMTKMEINMNGDGNTEMPAELIELLKTADVTNITERIKILSSTMFNEMTPDVITKIQNGIQKGVDGIQSGISDMDKNIVDLKAGAEGVAKGISGMKSAVAGMDQGIAGMKNAISSQENAIVQLNGLYDQMTKMMSQGNQGGTENTGMPASTGMPSGTEMSTGTGMPTGMGDVSIIDMIPESVKAKIPESVLEQLKDVKTPEDLKEKIDELTNAKKTLSGEVEKLTKQREDMLAKIAETETKREGMLTAISSMEAAEADMNDTVKKMTVMKEAVPKAFEEANENYLAEIDKLSPEIESEFQDTLNVGFRQIYLTTGIASLIALIILIFYRNKRNNEVSKPIAQ